MRSSLDRKSFDADNQFLQAPLTQRSRLKDKQQLSQDIRGKYISELEQRNRRLKIEIIKINQALTEQTEKLSVKKQPPKLIPFNSGGQVLKKQLQNVYKQIKTYEHDIAALQAKQAGGLITERMSRMENILKEKNDMIDKLRTELAILSKKTVEHSKKLKDNTGKEQLQTAMLKHNQEIKVMREKIREVDQKEKKKQENAKKQYEYIKKIEKELIENGVSTDQLEDIRKNNLFNNIFEMANSKDPNERKRNNSVMDVPKEEKQMKEGEIEQLTLDRYKMLKNDILTYRKLQQDYQKKYDQLSQQKQSEENNKIEVRMKLIEKQSELQELDSELSQLKLKAKKIQFKPKPLSVKKQQEKPKNKVNYGRVKPKNQDGDLQSHGSLKYDEKGVKTQKGQRFSDRPIIGKNFNSRIVAVKVWTQKYNFNICGIQCTYKIDQVIKPGGDHVNKAGLQSYTENFFQMFDGDFLKSVSGSLGPSNIIQYLVLISNNSKIARYGVVKPNQKQFNFDIQDLEIPVCMYGSLSTKTEPGKPDISLLQHLGFEITQDGKSERSSV